MWPHESLWFCNDLALSDLTITMATAHTYVRAACDGDSFVEREREKRGTRVGKDGGEYEAPPNSPKNNLQLWMNTLSQVKF